MRFLFVNPEIQRNVRGQLRLPRMIVCAVIAALVSICIGYVFYRSSGPEIRYDWRPVGGLWGRQLLQAILWVQALILAAGGSIVCVNSIYREKEQSSFDFQRMTQLTPLQLTIGKLFGAPVLMYFLCLCLMPAALFGAFIGGVKVSFVVAAYVLLIVGSIAFHLFSLLVSLLAFRGANTSVIVVVLLVLWLSVYSGAAFNGALQIGLLGPFLAPELSMQTTWDVRELRARFGDKDINYEYNNPMVATAFGHDVHEASANFTVSFALALWVLLGVVRNIKRDPNVYEIFSPLQGLGFALFLNVLFLAFMRWRWGKPVDAQAYLLTLNIFVFVCFGMAQLRNRERMRRALRHSAKMKGSLLDSVWPLPILVVAAGLATLMGVIAMGLNQDLKSEWSPNFALLRALFFVLWIVRDMQYLQWMNLRRGKFPLVLGVSFLAVYYACASTVLAAMGAFRSVDRAPFTALFLPSPFYLLDHATWIVSPAIWTAAYLLQVLLIGVFLFLQGKILREMSLGSLSGVPVEARA